MQKRKTMKKSSYEQLDKAMLEWFTQERALGNPISGPICASQVNFFSTFGLEGEFDASSGWLIWFKHRHGVREIGIQGEKLSGNEEAANEFVKDFEEFIIKENVTRDQIYNADESGLNWKCLPTRTLAFKSERHAPGHKSRIQKLKSDAQHRAPIFRRFARLFGRSGRQFVVWYNGIA